MSMERTVIVVRTTPPGDDENEWNHWYENTHIAARLEIPGFLLIRRFQLSSGLPATFSLDGPRYLAVYEVENPSVLTSDPYLKLTKSEAERPEDSFEARTRSHPDNSRGIFRQIFPEENYSRPNNADYLLAVGHVDLPQDVLDEYHAWYNTEHIPSYLQIPGVLNARRFAISSLPSGATSRSGPHGSDYIALYDLENDAVFESQAFVERSTTPWSTRVREWTWKRRRMNNSYKCIYSSDS